MFDSSGEETDGVELSPSMALFNRQCVSNKQVERSIKRLSSSEASQLAAGTRIVRRKKRRVVINDDDGEDSSNLAENTNVADTSAFYLSMAEAEELEEFKQAKDEGQIQTIVDKLSSREVHDSDVLQQFEMTLNAVSSRAVQETNQPSKIFRLICEAWRRMASFCRERQCHPKALFYYLKALELNDTDLDGWQTVYRIAFDLGRYDLCADACQHACRISSKTSSGDIDLLAVEYLIIIYCAVFNFDQCMLLVWQALGRDPYHLAARVVAQQVLDEDDCLLRRYGYRWEQLCYYHHIDDSVLKNATTTIMHRCTTVRQKYFNIDGDAKDANSSLGGRQDCSVTSSRCFDKVHKLAAVPEMSLSRVSSLADLGKFLLSIEKHISKWLYANPISVAGGYCEISDPVSDDSSQILQHDGRDRQHISLPDVSERVHSEAETVNEITAAPEKARLSLHAQTTPSDCGSSVFAIASNVACPKMTELHAERALSVANEAENNNKRRRCSRRLRFSQTTNETLNAFRKLFTQLEPPVAWLFDDAGSENFSEQSSIPEHDVHRGKVSCSLHAPTSACFGANLSVADSIHAAQTVINNECKVSENGTTLIFVWHRILLAYCNACADVADRKWSSELISAFKSLYLSLRRIYPLPGAERLEHGFSENADDDDYADQKSDEENYRQKLASYCDHCRLVLCANEILVDSLLQWKRNAAASLSSFKYHEQHLIHTLECGEFFNEDLPFLEQLCTLNAPQLFAVLLEPGEPNAALPYKLEGWRLFVRILFLFARHAEYFLTTDAEQQCSRNDDDLAVMEKYLNSAHLMMVSAEKRLKLTESIEKEEARVLLPNCQSAKADAPLVVSAETLRLQLDELLAERMEALMGKFWFDKNYKEYISAFCTRYRLESVLDACDIKFLSRNDVHENVWRLVDSLSLMSSVEPSSELVTLLEPWLCVYVSVKLKMVDDDAVDDIDNSSSADSNDETADGGFCLPDGYVHWRADIVRIMDLLYEHVDVRQHDLFPHEALNIALTADNERLRRLAKSVYNALLVIFARETPSALQNCYGLPTTSPFIILALVFQLLPTTNSPAQLPQISADIAENAPLFCQFLYHTHSFLANSLHACTLRSGQFLAFSAEVLRNFVHKLDSNNTVHATHPRVLHIRDEACDELDQIFYCLFHHRRSKKSLFDKHADTGDVSLSLQTAHILYQHFLPATLPIPDGHRQETLVSDVKDAFMCILSVLEGAGEFGAANNNIEPAHSSSCAAAFMLKPAQLRQIETGMHEKFTEITQLHAKRCSQLVHECGKRSPVRRAASIAEHLYYCLADWHCKLEWYDQAHEYYRSDLRRNPSRVESWVGVAMTARVMGGNDMKMTGFDFTSLHEYDRCEEALNYFRIALLRFSGREEEPMWIELGLMAYEMQTCLSWRVKMDLEARADKAAVAADENDAVRDVHNIINSAALHADNVETDVNALLLEILLPSPPVTTAGGNVLKSDGQKNVSTTGYLITTLLPSSSSNSRNCSNEIEQLMMYSAEALPALYMFNKSTNRDLAPNAAENCTDDTMRLNRRCLVRQRQLLLVCLHAFARAEHYNVEQNEHWLHHYMMGKCAEKLRPHEPERYLLHYMFSLEALDKIQKCSYPTQTTWSNWNKLGADMNAIELFYRVHASALKFLTVYSVRSKRAFNKQQVAFLRCLLEDLAQSPFVLNTSGANSSSSTKPAAAGKNDTTPTITAGDKSRKRREQPAQQSVSYTAEQWTVHTQLLTAKYFSHVQQNLNEDDDDDIICEDDEDAVNEATRSKLIDQCLHGIHVVLERCPWHYKAINRLADLYANFRPMADEDQVRALLTGGGAHHHHVAHWKPPRGLFQDRRANNFFNGVWQLPDDEIQRCFTFSNHLYRAASMLMQVLRRDGECQMLMQMALQFAKPNPRHSYLRDADYAALAQRACRLAFATIYEQVPVYAPTAAVAAVVGDMQQQTIAPDSRAAFVRNVWKCYKMCKDSKLNVPKIAHRVLVDAYENERKLSANFQQQKKNEAPVDSNERYSLSKVKEAQRYFNAAFGNANQSAKVGGNLSSKVTSGANTTKITRTPSQTLSSSSSVSSHDGFESEENRNMPIGVAGFELLTQSTTSDFQSGQRSFGAARPQKPDTNDAGEINAASSAVSSPLAVGAQHVLSPGDIADLENLLDEDETMRQLL